MKILPVILFILCLLSSACSGIIPKEALIWNEETLRYKQLQTRQFQTNDEGFILQAVAGLLQDLGFNIDESETPLGVIVASKNRDATDAGQIAGAFLIAVLVGVNTPVDSHQTMRASVVTFPSASGGSISVRVTFQRIIWNDRGQVSKTEPMKNPEHYDTFFKKLSKSVFLEAHEI